MFLRRAALGAASGALLVLSLPKPDLYLLGFIALVPLLVVLDGRGTRKQAFAVGYLAGVTFFGGSCYWIVTTMNTYGGLGLATSVAMFVLFVAVFAGHTGLFALLVHNCSRRWGRQGVWLAAPFWVAIELAQTHLIFGGFPWMLAGYALVPLGGLLQIVTWTGVYGLSFVVVAVNAGLADSIRFRDWRPAVGTMAVVTVILLMPAPAAETPRTGTDTVAVRIVQTRIPIDFPWGGARERDLIDELSRLSIDGESNPALVVWPETPGPFLLTEGSRFASVIGTVAAALDAHVLVGYVDFKGDMPTNSAGLVSPEGVQVFRYDKIHLVPFGEYVPLGNVFFFAESLVRNVGDFAPGTDFGTSTLGEHRIAATICYEDVFPALMRQFSRNGAELIVNITNDGWFGSSSAPYQHLRMSRVRAVESRRWIVRAANTGISAIIDPYGNVVSRTALDERTTLEGEARYRTDLTPYVRMGDVFAFVMVLVAAASLVVPTGRRERKTSQ